jgi:hypothetical protein
MQHGRIFMSHLGLILPKNVERITCLDPQLQFWKRLVKLDAIPEYVIKNLLREFTLFFSSISKALHFINWCIIYWRKSKKFKTNLWGYYCII